MDFLTCLPVSAGYTTILVIVDMLTKMAHFIPCRRIPTAKVTAHLFIQHIFKLHGLPDTVVSDRGTQFTAAFWKELMSALQIQVSLASTHHPETDGGTEKVIGILEQYLRCFINDQQNDWSKYLPVAEFAFNNSQHTSTQTTPFFANYGYHPRLFPLTLRDSPVPVAQEFLSELYSIHDLVKQHLDQAKADYKRFADRSRRDTPPLTVGDRVWLSTKYLFPGKAHRKLDQRFMGPFPVERVINPVTYRLTLPRTLRVHPVFHRSLLVPVSPDSPLRAPASDPAPPRAQVPVAQWEVHAVRDSRWLKNRFQYLVEWTGGGPDTSIWIDARDLDAPDLIMDFHIQFPDKPHPLRQTRGKGPVGRGPGGGDSVVIASRPAGAMIEDEDEYAEPSGAEGIAEGGELEAEMEWQAGDFPEGGVSSDSDGELIGHWLDARNRRRDTRRKQLGWS